MFKLEACVVKFTKPKVRKLIKVKKSEAILAVLYENGSPHLSSKTFRIHLFHSKPQMLISCRQFIILQWINGCIMFHQVGADIRRKSENEN